MDETEKDYKKCWKFLNAWKEGQLKLSADDVLSYQPRLAEAFLHLGEVNYSLSQEHNSLISRKNSLSLKWFKQRMKRLSEYQRAITEVIKIGRILGDSFAWIFYQRERKYLRKHFAHQETLQVPTGLGGKGEVAFITKVRTWNGQLTIYHGITSFLRIGDVSFYDPNLKRITGIGEIKTHTDSGSSVGMHLHLLWPENSEKIWPQPSEPLNASEQPLPFKRQQQLKRQLKTMAASFNEPKVSQVIKIRDKTHLHEFRKLAEGLGKKTLVIEKAGDGLLLVGFRSNREKSLFGRLLPKTTADFKKRLKGIETYAHRIMDLTQVGTSSNTNSIFIGSLDLGAFPGTTPMFWWSVPSEFVRKLIFHEVTVVALYNPAHLIRKLRASGFEAQLKGTQLTVTKRLGTFQFEMGNMQHFLHYVQQHLIREDFILAIFQTLLDRIDAGEILPNTKIDLDTQLYY
jgi:hypothetical protein